MEYKSKNKFGNEMKNENSQDDYLKVVREEQNFPIEFSGFIPLKKVLEYYDNNWTENLDEDDSDDDEDDDDDNVKVKKNNYGDSSSDD